MSITKVIDVEETDPTPPPFKYGTEWRQAMTGKQLLKLQLPEVLKRGTVTISIDRPTTARKIIDHLDIPKLDLIPPMVTIDEAREKLNEVEKESGQAPWGVEISDFGYITFSAVLFLSKIFQNERVY